VTHHPDTHHDFTDLKVPEWGRLLTMAASCYEMTGLGYLGADIVFDKDEGALLLELNARPGLAIQIANGKGLRRRLEKVDAQKQVLTAKERVLFSMYKLV
jgi:D-alanine-D-alanine ligase-like ATP-grasp enzyme